MNTRTPSVILAAIICTSLFGGCKDDHSGHDHGKEKNSSHKDHQHQEGDDHDKPKS